jgi:hypothetical protein
MDTPQPPRVLWPFVVTAMGATAIASAVLGAALS